MVAVGCIIMLVVGRQQYEMRRNRIRCRFSADAMKVIAGFLSVITGILLVKESMLGMIQLIQNHLSVGDDPIYAIIIAFISVPIILCIYGFILYCIGVASAASKREKLRRERRRRNNDSYNPWV